MPLEYNNLTDSITDKILFNRSRNVINEFRCFDESVIRRLDNERDKPTIIRPAFVRDAEKILHLPVYNRYSDKTQVFSFYHNDDISRRSFHVQLVSRIARNIGAVLGLNLDLIEAIALGHDLGHTPFGHAGERFLSELYNNETGRYFNHNVHSVRILDRLYKRNVSLQTLDGILCHNGEFEKSEYLPKSGLTFSELDETVEKCYSIGASAIESLIPSTLEGCVVRISDMIAYLGKDRQDARIAKIINNDTKFSNGKIGTENSVIINNITVDIIENSYGKNYILLSDDVYEALKTAKQENYRLIYKNKVTNDLYDVSVKPMFSEMYYKLLYDIKNKDSGSIIYKHHIDHIRSNTVHYGDFDYLNETPNDIVVDFIASMTDDYFLDLHKLLFPNSKYRIEFKSYFE